MTTPVYIDTLMRGNSYVRRTVGKFLYEKMPMYIDIMRLQNDDLDASKLPYPKRYDAVDPYSDTEFPMVGTYFSGVDNFSRTHVRPSGASDFESEYEATLFVAAKTPINASPTKDGQVSWEKPERDAAVRVRDDLMAIMRACILETPSCGTAGQSNAIVIDRNSIKEAYQEPVKSNNQTPWWFAVGFMNVNIKVTESTAVPIVGTANTFDIEADRLF